MLHHRVVAVAAVVAAVAHFAAAGGDDNNNNNGYDATAVNTRDYTYYYADGFANPMATQTLYYKDAANVWADLTSFQSLYIKYESCAYVI